MSPKAADPDVRISLLDVGARITAEQGSAALSLRGLAAEVGTSTMAIYTHFGSMDELRRAIRREGFDRLGAYLGAVEDTDDPVADLCLLGVAYYLNAMANPNLYRAMFMEHPVDDEDTSAGHDTFEPLLRGVGRCIATGRFEPADPDALARQIWALSHGTVALRLAGLFDDDACLAALRDGGSSLFRSYGDDDTRLEQSMAAALDAASRLQPNT